MESRSLKTLLNSITPSIYESLKQAVELGKWANGVELNAQQRQLCLQAIIAWEHQHLPEEQHTGFMPKSQVCASSKQDQYNQNEEQQVLHLN